MGIEELPQGIEVPLQIKDKHDKPCVELRKVTTEEDIIKLLVKSAYHQQPLIIYPVFKDRIRSIGNLIEKGIIYQEGEQYFFTV